MPIKSPYVAIPVTEELLHEKVLKAIHSHATKFPKKPALIQADNEKNILTFGDIEAQTKAAAAYISKLGVSSGDVVCMVLSNCMEYAMVYLSILATGAAMSPASAMFTEFELERQFRDSKSKLIVTDGPSLNKCLKAAAKCDGAQIICIRRTDGTKLPGVHDWSNVIRTPAANLPTISTKADDLALLPYSSGTTGSPKGVMLSHKNFATTVEVLKAHFDELISTKSGSPNPKGWYHQNLALTLPFYHGYGFAVLNMSLLTGATGYVLQKFEPNLYLSTVQKHKVEILTLVPPLLLFLAKHPTVDKYDISSVRIVKCRSAPVGAEVVDEFVRRHKNVKYVEQVYGLTECGMVFHRPMFDAFDKNPVGHPSPSFEIKIIDPNTGAELERGKRGEICLRSPTVMKGYFNRPDATKETLDNDRWLKTGDIGYIDEKGQTFIVDRIKELIKVKGFQVAPAELEDLLLGHPGVADVAVIGVPDEKTGEKPKAFIVKADPHLTEKDVHKFVESKVVNYKWLTGGIQFLTQIPKSPSGKILRRMLRDQYKAKL